METPEQTLRFVKQFLEAGKMSTPPRDMAALRIGQVARVPCYTCDRSRGRGGLAPGADPRCARCQGQPEKEAAKGLTFCYGCGARCPRVVDPGQPPLCSDCVPDAVGYPRHTTYRASCHVCGLTATAAEEGEPTGEIWVCGGCNLDGSKVSQIEWAPLGVKDLWPPYLPVKDLLRIFSAASGWCPSAPPPAPPSGALRP